MQTVRLYAIVSVCAVGLLHAGFGKARALLLDSLTASLAVLGAGVGLMLLLSLPG
jgi:hypothetical protein